MEYLDLNIDGTVDQALRRLNEYTHLTFLSPGSKARLLIEILGEELGIEAERFDENVGLALLRGARGRMLDYIGELYDMDRLLEIKAEVFAEEENFLLYTLEPNFGSINNGQDIIIPEGELRIYNTMTPGANQVTYINTERIVLPRDSNSFYFAAEALTGGESSNVGENSLVFHTFSNYADSLSQTLLVRNTQSIVYGRDEESDENFRYRIQKEKISGEAGNETAIRLAALVVPGVSNIVRVPYLRGIGTADWLIKSTATTVSQELIDSVQRAINEKQSSGSANLARSPNTIGVELIFPLTYKGSLEDTEKDKIKAEVRKNITSYINNLEIGESFISDQVVRIVLNSSDQIESMGPVNSSSNFSNIFIYKRSGLSNSVLRKRLVSDYRATQYERVVLEPGISTPITIFDNN